MKIIRIRRGFSTNCSGANEFFPAGQQFLAPPTPEQIEDDLLPQGTFRWLLPSTAAKHVKVTSRWVAPTPDGGASNITTNQPDSGSSASESTTTTTNGLVIAAVVIGVAVLFGVERLVRSLRRRARNESHDEPAED